MAGFVDPCKVVARKRAFYNPSEQNRSENKKKERNK
jgi:hypothetical protein